MFHDKQEQEVPESIVMENMPLVESIASSIIGCGKVPPVINFEDLVSWGVEGLLKAYRNFKSDKGSQFNTYAYYRIRGEMLDRIRTEWQYRNPSEYSSYRKKLQERLADFVEDYSENDGAVVPGREVRDLITNAGISYLISIDNIEVGSDKEGLMNPEDEYIVEETNKEIGSVLTEEIDELEEDEKRIVQLFYVEGLKQKEIADHMKYSKSKVCRIHMKVLDKLKRRLKRRAEEGAVQL